MKRYILLLFTFFLSFPAVFLQAEEIDVYGVKFKYELLEQIDDSLSKILLPGKLSPKIVTKNQLPYVLLNHYVSSNAHVFSEYTLSKLFANAVKNNDMPSAEVIFKRAARENFWNRNNIELFFNYVHRNFLESFVRNNSQFIENISDKIFDQFFLYKAKDFIDTEIIKNKVSKKVLYSVLEREVLSLIKGQKKVNAVNTVYEDFQNFLKEDPEYKKLKDFIELYFGMLNNNKAFSPNYKVLQSTFPKLFKEIFPLLEKIKSNNIEEFISSKRSKLALDSLMITSFNERNETVHNQVIEVINTIDANTAPILLLEPYKSYLLSLSQKDSRIKKVLISKYETIINNLFKSKNIFAANEYLVSLFAVRPNPDTQNSDLIFRQIKILDDQGLVHQANQVRLRDKTNFSWKQNYWFFKKGYFISIPLLMFTIVFLTLSLIFRKKILRMTGVVEEIFKEEEVATRRAAGRNLKHQLSKLNPAWQKYQALLMEFDINTSVSKDAIKKTYRQKIKKYHPDLNPEQSTEDHDMFLLITERYETLLKLHEEITANEGQTKIS